MTVPLTEQWLAWDAERGFSPATAPGGDLLAADSWLVEDGRVRGIERHEARFAEACAHGGVEPATLGPFWQEVIGELPRGGLWFPRVELHETGMLALRLRRAPDLLPAVRVLPWPHADPRTAPRRKGPDLGSLAQVRAHARAAGADDALFTTEDGRVTESATASLLWWEGPELCLPDAEPHLLPGVTSALVVRLARDRGIVVRRARARLDDLYGREVWLVNALHGIRPVTEWVGTGRGAVRAERAPSWQRLLRARARHLDDHRLAGEPPAPQVTNTHKGSPT